MIDVEALDWAKMDGLIPGIVQDEGTGQVLMLGYLNREALAATLDTGFVTFFSRSKQRLWTKGESSGNRLQLVSARGDCDGDSLLLRARPFGPTCHLGTQTCFGDQAGPCASSSLAWLEEIQGQRTEQASPESYTARLMAAGVKRIAQKVGEEGVETALAAVGGDPSEVTSEAADLIYHLLLLLRSGGSSLGAVVAELRRRHSESSATASS